jgi:hypothetical protein
MPFQISELVIRVTGDSPDGAIENKQPAVSECRQGGHTCLPDATNCRKGGSTCPDVTNCRHGGTTCMPDVPSNCRVGGTTCAPPGPSKSQPKKAEMDFVLQQIRDAVASEEEPAEELVTA